LSAAWAAVRSNEGTGKEEGLQSPTPTGQGATKKRRGEIQEYLLAQTAVAEQKGQGENEAALTT